MTLHRIPLDRAFSRDRYFTPGAPVQDFTTPLDGERDVPEFETARNRPLTPAELEAVFGRDQMSVSELAELDRERKAA